jgi:MFS transporter, AAHS family, benzoate transport protein
MTTATHVPGGTTAGQSPSSQPTIPGRSRSGLAVTVLCFLAIVFDGYDLVIFGSTVPSLLADEAWSIDAAQVGVIGSLALVGMLIGTLFVGALTDILGRRTIMMLSIAWFSIFMLATALAPTPELFGVFRFVTGIGLGGIVPTCVAMTVEFAPKSRRQITNAVMYSGYSVGGVLAAIVALLALPTVDFRWLYAFGALPLVVLLPIVHRLMPESIAFLASKGRQDEARATAARYGVVYEDVVTPTDAGAAVESGRFSALKVLFSGPMIVATILFGLASFCGLLLVYGMNTWLPAIMRQAGYELGSSLVFLLSLNAGAIVGAITASHVADRIGVKKVVTACFAIALTSTLLLSVELPYALLLLIVAFAGLGSVGTQILINGFVATHYPQTSSATALGWSLGVGRLGAIAGPLIGGYVAALGTGYEVNFYVFAAVALAGGIVIAAVPAARAVARSTS